MAKYKQIMLRSTNILNHWKMNMETGESILKHTHREGIKEACKFCIRYG